MVLTILPYPPKRIVSSRVPDIRYRLTMPTLPLPIETDRLLLRAFTPDDIDRFHSYRSLPEVTRYLYRDPKTLEQAIASVLKFAQLEFEKDGDMLSLAVQAKGSPILIGEAVLKLANTLSEQAEVGYILHPDAVGHGYATEAARAMLKLGFEHYGFHRIFARIDAENAASAAVARRLGMRQEAHLIESERFNGRWGSETVFAMLASEWRALTVS